MYTKEQAKQLRTNFWNQFKTWSGYLRSKEGKKGRWIMDQTGIKQMKLRFHFDEHWALVGIAIDTRNLKKREELWNKLASLRKVLEEKSNFHLLWEKDTILYESKHVSRIFTRLESVSIYQKDDWKKVNDFFYKRMMIFEDFFLEYRDYLKKNRQ